MVKYTEKIHNIGEIILSKMKIEECNIV